MLDRMIARCTLCAATSLPSSALSVLDRALLLFPGKVPVNDDAYVPLSRLAELLGVTVGTVRHWRYRGWLDGDGKRRHLRVRGRLYCAADAFAAERDTRLSGQSHRAGPVRQRASRPAAA